MRSNFAVRWLPEPDKITPGAEHDSVIPPPDNRQRGVRRGRDGHQVTRGDPLSPRRGESRHVPDRGQPPGPQYLARILPNKS